jgi:hypothetical protein
MMKVSSGGQKGYPSASFGSVDQRLEHIVQQLQFETDGVAHWHQHGTDEDGTGEDTAYCALLRRSSPTDVSTDTEQAERMLHEPLKQIVGTP